MVKISAKFTDFRRSKFDLEIRIELRLFLQDNLVRKKMAIETRRIYDWPSNFWMRFNYKAGVSLFDERKYNR